MKIKSGPTTVVAGFKPWIWRVRAEGKLGLLLLLQRLGVLRWLNLHIPIAHADEHTKLLIPLLGGAGLQNIIMTERWMNTLLKILFQARPDGVFIDVGVNVGQTLIKLRRLRPAQPYLGFEPNPSCLHYLSELFRLNDLGDTLVVPVGLDTAVALRELVYYDASDAVSSSATLRGESFRPHHRVTGRKVVPLMPFEAATSSLLQGPPGIIKIDVEGAEELVLETLVPTLVQARSPVILEILPEPTDEANAEKNRRLTALVARIDYRIYRVRKLGEDYAGLMPVTNMGNNRDPEGWDYVLLPVECGDL